MDARTELIIPGPAEALAGLLGVAAPPMGPGDPVPPLWHWVYLLERRRQSDLGPDGHPVSGVPSPPGPGQSRMFAGGRVMTLSPLRFGESATRTISVAHRVDKVGRSGPLAFVTTRTEIVQGGAVAIVEEQDIVYRKQAPDPAGQAAAAATVAEETGAAATGADAPPLLELDVDPVVLFRFSALTYNAHRIHYDQAHAAREGYPDLVVHGPLQAMLMAEAFRRSDRTLVGRQFAYRLVAPTFGTQRIAVIQGEPGRPSALRVRDGHGVITATGDLRD